MIHQLIFAAPKPGMSEAEFQRYWLEEHAVRYASRIPQIRKYLIDARIPYGPEDGEPKWSGCAEIWLANDEEQLASLQTPEFLQGARLDEPNWAAFWRTVVLDTDAHELLAGPALTSNPGWVKLIRLVKRREGLPLADFREASLTKQAELMLAVPGLRRYLQCHTRDGAYGIGEAVLDAAHQWWFDDVAALTAALASPEFQRADEQLGSIVEPRYVHDLAFTEHWVIGPESRNP
jgi:EthD domain-containing protein